MDSLPPWRSLLRAALQREGRFSNSEICQTRKSAGFCLGLEASFDCAQGALSLLLRSCSSSVNTTGKTSHLPLGPYGAGRSQESPSSWRQPFPRNLTTPHRCPVTLNC